MVYNTQRIKVRKSVKQLVHHCQHTVTTTAGASFVSLFLLRFVSYRIVTTGEKSHSTIIKQNSTITMTAITRLRWRGRGGGEGYCICFIRDSSLWLLWRTEREKKITSRWIHPPPPSLDPKWRPMSGWVNVCCCHLFFFFPFFFVCEEGDNGSRVANSLAGYDRRVEEEEGNWRRCCSWWFIQAYVSCAADDDDDDDVRRIRQRKTKDYEAFEMLINEISGTREPLL